MSLSNTYDWSKWTCLPRTNDIGLDEFKGLQFAYPRTDYKFSDWYNNCAFTVHDQNIGRTFEVFGYPIQDFSTFRSGPSLEWDFIIDNIPESNTTADAIPIYSVDFPDYWQNKNYPCPRLEVRAVRGAIQYNKKIGRLSRYGTYVTVGIAVWQIIYDPTDGTLYENRLTMNQIEAQVYKNAERDVGGVDTRLEFFYLNEEMLETIRGGFQHIFPTDPTYNDWKVGDFMLGITSSAVVTGDGFITHYRLWYPTQEAFGEWLGGLPDGEKYDRAFGDGSETGGYDDDPGTHDFHSDDISHSGSPTLSVLSSGFVNAYKVTTGLLTNLGRALFPQNLLSMDATGLSDAQVILKSFRYLIDTQQNKGAIDYIIDCHIVPVNVPTSGTANITAGGKVLKDPDAEHPLDPLYGTPYPAPVVTGTYVTKSCGSITIPEAYGNFLDYTVRCKLYLPFYGYVDIPAEYWNGGTLSVEYMFNIYDGSFVAFVNGRAKHSGLNSLIGQYAGSACTHIPVSGRDYSQMVSGLLSAGIGTIATAMTGGAGGVVAGVGAMGSGLANVLSMKQPMVSNGSSNSSSAMMMHKKPYLIIEYPTSQFSTRYPKEKGLPLNVEGSLGQFGGLTIAENPVLSGIPCTENEKERIRNALKTGLIFR